MIRLEDLPPPYLIEGEQPGVVNQFTYMIGRTQFGVCYSHDFDEWQDCTMERSWVWMDDMTEGSKPRLLMHADAQVSDAERKKTAEEATRFLFSAIKDLDIELPKYRLRKRKDQANFDRLSEGAFSWRLDEAVDAAIAAGQSAFTMDGLACPTDTGRMFMKLTMQLSEVVTWDGAEVPVRSRGGRDADI